MKCLAYLFLILFVATHASVNTNADVSSNLLSNNFYTDWTGTNDHFHGSNILAGVHNEYREQTITLSDHLSPMEIQGVTSTEFNAEVWFWNQYDQSVDLTQEITDSNGLTYSNTITMSGDCNTFNGCGYQTSPTNTIIITNPSSDYDITARFDFTIPSHPNSHYAADVKDPSLVVNYNPLSIDLSTTDDLSLWLGDFEESFSQEFSEPDFYIMEDIFEEEELLLNDYFTFEEPGVIFLPQEPTELPDLMLMEEAPIFFSDEFTMEEPMSIEEMREEIISDIETLMPDMPDEMVEELMEEIMEDMPIEETITEEQEEIIEEEPTEEVIEEEDEDILEEKKFSEDTKSGGETVMTNVSIMKEDNVSKVEVNSIDVAIHLDNISFEELISTQPILVDVPFYEPVILYPNQLSYIDSP